MYQFFNAHPKGLIVGDCVKRAISKAANMAYHQVQLELNRYKKITGDKSYNSGYNPHKYVENILHGVKLSFPAQKGKPRMNGKRFCKEYPRGNYILNMAGHWSCCVDGVIYDTWDCSEKCVYTAYKIPTKESEHRVFRVRIHNASICDQDRIESTNMDEIIKQMKKDFNRYCKTLKENPDNVVKFEITPDFSY